MSKHSHGHNRWLDWKIRHGLATRGHTGGRMHPKGLVAGVIYKLIFKRFDKTGAEQSKGGQIFKQSVGGTLGASGKTNEAGD